MTGKTLLRAASLSLVLLLGAQASAQDAAGDAASAEDAANPDRVLGDRIAEGLVADGRLWVRGLKRGMEPGGLVAIDMASGARRVVAQDGVIDMAKRDGRLWLLRQGERPNQAEAAQWLDGRFQALPHLTAPFGAGILALLVGRDGPVILTSRAVISWSPTARKWITTRLKGRLRADAVNVTTMPAAANDIYIGLDLGEWGGGLQRIDGDTGAVTEVESTQKGADKEELLSHSLDPVTGLLPDPDDGACVLASTGLSHMGFTNGRLLKVCRGRVSPALEIPFAIEVNDRSIPQSTPFFGMARGRAGQVWLVSYGVLYRLSSPSDAHPAKIDLPTLKRFGGLSMSRDIPGVVIMRTDVNWARSVSGYTPLVVSTED